MASGIFKPVAITMSVSRKGEFSLKALPATQFELAKLVLISIQLWMTAPMFVMGEERGMLIKRNIGTRNAQSG
jgi:hypothetical protein